MLLTSLDLAVRDLHIFAASDVDAVGVWARARCSNRQTCQVRIGAVFHRHVDLLAVHNFQILHPQIRAEVERQSGRSLLARLHRKVVLGQDTFELKSIINFQKV